MRRLSPVLLLLIIGCGGGGTAPVRVQSVSVVAPTNILSLGETVTLTADVRDANGATLTGRAVTWSSANPAIATVSAAGVVTGASSGTVIIRAAVGSVSGQTSMTVIASGPADCTGVIPMTLAVMEIRPIGGADRSKLCLSGGTSGAEFTLVSVNASMSRRNASVAMWATNIVEPTANPLAAVRAADLPSASPRALTSALAVAGAMPRDLGFERRLRALWDQERLLQRARGRVPATRGPAPSLIRGLPASPALGTLVELNASSTSACETPLRRTAKVRAVSSTAIVVEDTTAPPGGFTDAEYLSIATTFDTLVFPLDTTLFGAPYDMDGNGRILLFFTSAVNQRTAPGATSIVGGFFWERDLVPRVANTFVPFSCANSNEGEMFYLPVVDVASRFNSFFTNKTTLLREINATAVHEFQHLINSSTRYYITPEIVDDEETWLDEGMSHVAEEMLYYRATGLQSRSDLRFAESTSGPGRLEALNAYQGDNLSRYNTYLRGTPTSSAYLNNEDIATRGATWALLRWALDHSPGASELYLRALVRAPTQGIPNFTRTFPALGGLAGVVVSSTVSAYTDNLHPSVPATWSHLSWNFREWLPHFTSNAGEYPLRGRSLLANTSQAFNLVPGGSTISRFRVNPGLTASFAIGYGGVDTADDVKLVLIRTQ